MTPLFLYTSVFFTIVFVVSLFACAWWFLYKRKFTRERFAFTLLINYTSVTFFILQIFNSSDSFFAIVNYGLVNLLGLPQIAVDEPGLAEKVLVCLVFFFYVKYTYSVYTNWSGGRSVVEANKASISINNYFFGDALRFVYKNDARVIAPKTKDEVAEDFSVQCMNVESISWRLQLPDLLKLISSQYKINVDTDWYSRENCYISTFGSNNQVLAILCSHSILADAKVSDFINFVRGQKKGSEILFLWGIRDGKESFVKEINGTKIQIVTENSLLDELIDLSDYERYIKRRFENEQIYDGYDLSINDIYVEPKCSVYDVTSKSNADINSIEEYVEDWLNDDFQHKQIAILGEYGQGKSVLSLRLAYRILTGGIKSNRIPIIIDLRGRFIKQYKDPFEILSTWAYRNDVNINSLLKLHYAGRLLLIFEGFDELDLIGDKEIRKDHFRKIWEFSIPKSKIIITGRPNYFLDDQEMVTLLRLSQQLQDGSKYCESIILKPFNRDQITLSLRNVSAKVRTEILQIYDAQPESSSFIDLVSRPSLLFLTGLIWEKENLASKSKDIYSADVIKSFLMYSYKRQDEKAQSGQTILMTSEERAYFMQGIAVEMVRKDGYTNIISSKDLEKIVERLLKDFPHEISQQTLNSNKKKLQNRLDSIHIIEAVQTDIRSCGVLVKDFSSKDAFCFAHKSFMELLVADFIADYYLIRKNSEKDIRWVKITGIVNALAINPNEIVLHRNVLGFMIELLAANIKLDVVTSPKEQVLSIYQQLGFYSVPASFLGIYMKLFGIYTYLTNFLLAEFAVLSVLVTFVAYHKGFAIVHSILIGLSVFTFTLVSLWISRNSSVFRIFFNTWLIDKLLSLTSNIVSRRDVFISLQNTKICIFYHICKKRKIEHAINEIWPKSVVEKVASLSDKYLAKEYRLSDNSDIFRVFQEN